MPRPKGKATRIADAILGVTPEKEKRQRKKRKKAEEPVVIPEGRMPR